MKKEQKLNQQKYDQITARRKLNQINMSGAVCYDCPTERSVGSPVRCGGNCLSGENFFGLPCEIPCYRWKNQLKSREEQYANQHNNSNNGPR